MAENGIRFIKGDYNAICDVCAQKYKASQMRKRWDGLMVCPHDYENRHPQDFLRAVPDRQAVPWSRPQTPDVFVQGLCPYPTSSGEADVGTADCARADSVLAGAILGTEEKRGVFPVSGGSLIDHEFIDNYDING